MTKWKKNNQQYTLQFRVNTYHPSVLNILSLNNSEILTSGSDGAIRLWHQDQQTTLFKKHKGWVWSLAKRDQNTFISCDSTGEIILWDIKNNTDLNHVKYDNSGFRCMTIYKNELFLGNEAGEIIRLNASNLALKDKWQAHKSIVRDIIVTHSGIISCGEDNKVIIIGHDRESKKELFTHSDFATSLCLIGDKELLSSSYGGRIENILF